MSSRFKRIIDVNSDQFNPIPAAACVLDPTVAAVMLIPEQPPLLHAAKLMIIRLCEGHSTAMVHSSVSGATASDDSSTGKANLVKKFSFLANKTFSLPLPTPRVIAVTAPKQYTVSSIDICQNSPNRTLTLTMDWGSGTIA